MKEYVTVSTFEVKLSKSAFSGFWWCPFISQTEKEIPGPEAAGKEEFVNCSEFPREDHCPGYEALLQPRGESHLRVSNRLGPGVQVAHEQVACETPSPSGRPGQTLPLATSRCGFCAPGNLPPTAPAHLLSSTQGGGCSLEEDFRCLH